MFLFNSGAIHIWEGFALFQIWDKNPVAFEVTNGGTYRKICGLEK